MAGKRERAKGGGEASAGAGAADQLSAHARDFGPRPETKEGRIAVMVELMANGEWITGLTGRQIATAWSIPYATIRGDAAEASRVFKVPDEERDAMIARWFAKLESDQARCRALGRMEALGTLMKLEGEHLGVFEPKKIDLNVSGDDEQLAGRLASLIAGEPEEADPGGAEPGGTTTH